MTFFFYLSVSLGFLFKCFFFCFFCFISYFGWTSPWCSWWATHKCTSKIMNGRWCLYACVCECVHSCWGACDHAQGRQRVVKEGKLVVNGGWLWSPSPPSLNLWYLLAPGCCGGGASLNILPSCRADGVICRGVGGKVKVSGWMGEYPRQFSPE